MAQCLKCQSRFHFAASRCFEVRQGGRPSQFKLFKPPIQAAIQGNLPSLQSKLTIGGFWKTNAFLLRDPQPPKRPLPHAPQRVSLPFHFAGLSASCVSCAAAPLVAPEWLGLAWPACFLFERSTVYPSTVPLPIVMCKD